MQYGFDLSPAQQASMTFATPPEHSRQPIKANGIRLRHRYSDAEEKCLENLIIVALRRLQRRLQRSDFWALTEALNRRISSSPDSGWALRGYNCVHTKVIRGPRFDLICTQAGFPPPAGQEVKPQNQHRIKKSVPTSVDPIRSSNPHPDSQGNFTTFGYRGGFSE